MGTAIAGHPLHTELLILQPTPFCNIDCSYCYLPHRTDRSRMTPQVVEAAFSRILPSPLAAHRLTVVWHAGEPLVLPPAWYEAAFATAERHRPPALALTHSLQTNATLIDRTWLPLLARPDVRISLSIDGPAHLHDANRRTRARRGTHARAMAGLNRLQDAGIFPSVITVLGRDSLDDPDALFEFYRANAIREVAFNVVEVEAATIASPIERADYEPAFGRFLARFLARMQAEPGTITLREHDSALALVATGGLPPGYNQESEPMRILSIAVDGRVSTFSPELLGMTDDRYADFTFGNVLTDDIETIAARINTSPLLADIAAGVRLCAATCPQFAYCRGGSPANKLYENGTFRSAETAYCRLTRQAVLDATLATFGVTGRSPTVDGWIS